MKLLNWPWLESLLGRAVEAEVRAFAADHPLESFFAFCLEFDGMGGVLACSYGTRKAVEQAAAAVDDLSRLSMRTLELRPEHWRYRACPWRDPDGLCSQVEPLLDRFRESTQTAEREGKAEALEFLWLRFEFLAECVIRRLIERDACRCLPRDPEFLAFAAHEHERLEELEDRLVKLYRGYRRATAEWTPLSRSGEILPADCSQRECPAPKGASSLQRCTRCQRWLCAHCRAAHAHPELARRRSFFRSPRRSA